MNVTNEDTRALRAFASRVSYHDSVERAVGDMSEEDQDRLRVAAETILAHPTDTENSHPTVVVGSDFRDAELALRRSEAEARVQQARLEVENVRLEIARLGAGVTQVDHEGQ